MKAKLKDVTSTDLKKSKKPKAKKEKKPRDIRSVFRESLAARAAAGGLEGFKKQWMSTKAFRILDTPEKLQSWMDDVLANAPKFEFYGNKLPVVGVDTETVGLDTRLFVRMEELPDGSCRQVYETKIELAGVCLSADGVEGVYIPICHEFQDLAFSTVAKNIDRAECSRILQKFFNQCHLVFYNAKYDREVLRLTLGIIFRPYPFFEDVQVLGYVNDPKANLEDKRFYTGDAGGLKTLSESILGIEQIELKDIAQVKAETCPIDGSPFCHCTPEQKKEKKHGLKNHFAPFPWVPVELALYYAASDAICTRLLWERMYELARSRHTVHRIDHELVDSIAWIERQRFIIDADRHARTVKGHQRKLDGLRKKLYDLGIAAGYREKSTDEGEVLEENKFNPGSTKQLQELFFKVKKFKSVKLTPGKQPSCDEEVIEALRKEHPEDEFLSTLLEFRDYEALHPSNLRFDPSDNSARIYLKQNVVSGGRLAAAGGEFEKDGGFGLNPQAIKKVEAYLMWKVRGNILKPDEVPIEQIEEHPEEALHPSCFREVEENGVKVRKKAPGIIKNHIGQYMGYAVCLVPKCTTCAEKFGILIPNEKLDANETVNLRALFYAPPGWTLFTIDYCLAPETRLLTSDLRWKLAGNVVKGEELIGFDEHLPSKRWGRRKLRPSIVKKVERLFLPCIRVTTDKGSIVCYEKHEWLTKVNAGSRAKKRGQYDWRATNELKVGQKIAYLCGVWEEDTSHEAGYLQGVFDGEGWVSKQALGFGQEEGCVLDTTEQLLKDKGFNFVRDNNHGKSRVSVLRSNGGRNEVFRFLGSIRPQRLLGNVRSKMRDGLDYQSKACRPAKILSVEHLGVLEVVAIRTSTHTFVAEGLLSHNCNIEMRIAANSSGEPEFIKEFLQGKGDFHSLTASKVFPEFNDPNTSKAIRKKLRDLAKIINFALLYGGTEYTIFENMRKQDPNITRERAQEMVEDYWKGVPVFWEFCQNKQAIARDKMLCTTVTGRVVNFKSAMEGLHIYVPAEEHRKNYWKYRDLMRRAEELKEEGRVDEADQYREPANSLWKDKDTGVRNCMDYNRFMGKIQRASVNIPFQGLAGDFMRMSLNKIRLWVESDPPVHAVIMLHGSVHDEIDFCVKDEYAPFVIPRITRLMKLRKLHKKMNWPVPIESDIEYGLSWDVEHHVTGDDDHVPMGWTEIKALANYVPDGWDTDTLKNLIKAIASGDERKASKASDFLKENLHERAFVASWYCFFRKQGQETVPQTDPKAIKKALLAAVQLDEYWRIDGVPDEEEDRLETLERYEARMGLAASGRNPFALKFGPLGSLPLDANVLRPRFEPLGTPVTRVTESENQGLSIQ